MSTTNIKGVTPVKITLKPLKPGEDYKFTIYIKDNNKVARDTTSWTMEIKGRANNASGSVVFSVSTSSGITHTPSQGKFAVKITAAVTAVIKVSHIAWDVKITDASGDISFPLEGVIEVKGTVTK